MKYILMLLLLLAAARSDAATRYVRIDGGTSSQCTGLADAPYPGSGTNQACAVSHPYWLFTLDGNNGGSTIIQGGDTVVIKSGSYAMGYGAPNTAACSTSWSYGCTMPAIPSGTSSNPTTIVGCSASGCGANTKPELHGTYAAYMVIHLGGSKYVTLKDLEITQHDTCERGGANPPTACTATGNNAAHGIYGHNSSNITLDGLSIHRISQYGIFAGGISNWTVTNTTIRANGYGGWNGDGGNVNFTGNFILNNSTIEYSGCSETYPGGVLSDCWGQSGSYGGYGDGVGFGNGTIGNWIITNSNISHNTQDGFDGLHGSGDGDSVYVNQSRFEGNAGQQIKVSAPLQMENSFVVGNCYYFDGQPFTVAVPNCRAEGDAIYLGLTAGRIHKIYNSTMALGGNVMLLTGGSSCDTNTKIHLSNNIWYGGYDWQQDSVANPDGYGDGRLTSFYWAGGSDGNGTGTCGTITPTQDYDIVYGTKNNASGCSGSHSKCNTDPGFAGTILSGPNANGYEAGDNIYTKLMLLVSSLAISSANAQLATYFSASDFNGTPRGTIWDIGALQYAITSPISGICGSSNGLSLPSAPTIGLCSAGTASAVTGTGPWSWSCAGSGGGSTANCSASLATIPIGNSSTVVACPVMAGFK